MSVPEVIKRKIAHYPAYYITKNMAYDWRLLKAQEPVYPVQFKKLGAAFIHIPKCAGNAITEAIYDRPSIDLGAHMTAIDLRKAAPEDFANAFKFTVVRHPLDRFISAFHFLRAGGMTRADKEWANAFIPATMSLEEFCDRLGGANWYKRAVMSFIHFRPQTHYICDQNENLLVDFIARHERINDDYQIIRERIGCGKPLKPTNVTERKPGQKHTIPSIAEEVAKELYAHDYKILGYQAPAKRS